MQLELPAMPPRLERKPSRSRHKRIPPPVHLMADIEATGGYRPKGEDTSLAPVLYAQDAACGFRRATNREIFVSAHELFKQRFRAGLPVTTYPELLRSFLQTKIGAQQCCVFLALFVTRDELLIQVAELFRGTSGYVNISPKEVARAAMACEAEGVICVRTDARGKSEPTEHDVSTARWLRKLFEVLEVPLRDYIVVGKGMVSLRAKGVIGRS
jgi:DNA repair protein RadC